LKLIFLAVLLITIPQKGIHKAMDPLELYFRQARAAGCPREQAEQFIRALYMPQPKQLAIHAAARECDGEGGPEYVGSGGTRGQAKSHAILAQVCLDDCQRFPGLKWLYLRKIQKKAGEQLGDLVQKVLVRVPYEFPQGILKFSNGSRVIIGGFRSESEIDGYIGIEYDGIIVEDATTITKAKIDQVFGSLRTSREDWRPRAYLSFNPGGAGHAWARQMFYDPWLAGRETITRFVHVTMGDNKFINPGYERYLNSLTGWLRRAWRDGDFGIAAGQYFVTFSPDIHVIEPINLDRPDAIWWLAMDYGFVHWNMTYLLAQAGDRIYVVDEHAARRQLVRENVEGIRAMLARNGSPWTRSFVVGSDVFAQRGTELTIAEEYAAHGFNLAPAKMDRVNGAGRVLELLGRPAPEAGEAVIDPRLLIFNRCAKLIECLPQMQHDPARGEDVLKVDCDEDTGEGGDDPYDALRYGLMEAATSSGWGVNPLAGYRG
jgi:Terminase large subunit, T4likevirus-type, N-terminal